MDVLVVVLVLGATALVALWWRSLDGRVLAADGAAFPREALGADPGTTLLVEFTAPGCAPCAQAKQVLDSVAARRDDVALVVADVGEHLDLARQHGILRAPTTLVVDPGGRVRHRIGGVPAAEDVERLLDAGRAAA
jgi:thioredoxin-like negative regulator of GroEL